MGRRGKVVLARINNENRRKATMGIRIGGLLKKVGEITTLCGAEAAAVIYKPDDNQPTVWPSTSAARATISRFLSRPEEEGTANSHTAKSFMEERCRKKKKKAQQLVKNNEERNIQALITSIYEGKTRIQDLDSEMKERLNNFTDQKIKEIRKRIQRLKKEQQAPHSAQVLPPAVQMPPVSQATSGLNTIGLGTGRNCQSPAAAHVHLMDGGMTEFVPALTFPLPTSNLFVMPDNTTAYLDTTRRFHGPSNFDDLMQQEALSLAQQMPSVSQVADGLQAQNIIRLAGGRNFPFPAPEANGQDMNFRGITASNLFVMLPNDTTAYRLDMTGRFQGLSNFDGIMQQEGLSLARQMPSVSQVADGLQALNINGLVGAAEAQGRDINRRGTDRLDMTGRLYGTPGGTTQLPLPSPSSNAYSEENVPDMTGYSLINASTWANIREMQQHIPPLSLPPHFPHTHSSSNAFDMTGRPYEQTDIGGTRTITGDGEFGKMMQDAPLSYILPELPRRQPPMPPKEYDTSGSNMSGAEYSRSTIRFPTPGTTVLDQSNFSDDYRLHTGGFPRPPTNPLDQRNFRDGE